MYHIVRLSSFVYQIPVFLSLFKLLNWDPIFLHLVRPVHFLEIAFNWEKTKAFSVNKEKTDHKLQFSIIIVN